jgi:hypothetical protein
MLPRACRHTTPQRGAIAVIGGPAWLPWERRQQMVPLLLWILGVPGLIIILLLLLGIIRI